ncbi:hypothetical protein [Streptomyces sp. NPDC002853]
MTRWIIAVEVRARLRTPETLAPTKWSLCLGEFSLVSAGFGVVGVAAVDGYAAVLQERAKVSMTAWVEAPAWTTSMRRRRHSRAAAVSSALSAGTKVLS